ncbi:hypothetical protein CPC08DRAFT_713658 [Agrocybe pediades]|nr:hypothetical protein CPC08DRAFT_713658 [Agrocybe pediades]
MSTNPVELPLTPGNKGWIAAVVNADFRQQAFIEVLNDKRVVITSATFQGRGTRVHMSNIFDNKPHWSFGPFNYNATVRVTISHSRSGDSYTNSKMVGPLIIHKAPETEYPIEFISSTVISEDLQDASHDDATVTVLQYKEPSK